MTTFEKNSKSALISCLEHLLIINGEIDNFEKMHGSTIEQQVCFFGLRKGEGLM